MKKINIEDVGIQLKFDSDGKCIFSVVDPSRGKDKMVQMLNIKDGEELYMVDTSFLVDLESLTNENVFIYLTGDVWRDLKKEDFCLDFDNATNPKKQDCIIDNKKIPANVRYIKVKKKG